MPLKVMKTHSEALEIQTKGKGTYEISGHVDAIYSKARTSARPAR